MEQAIITKTYRGKPGMRICGLALIAIAGCGLCLSGCTTMTETQTTTQTTSTTANKEARQRIGLR